MPGMHVLKDELLGAEASNDPDRLQIMIDVASLGISGYQAADWLHEHERIDVHLGDHARIIATISIADDEATADRLSRVLEQLIDAADDLPEPKPIKIPDPAGLELETVNRPRDAFFSRFEDVKAKDAAGRVAAEQITPYPPGIPAILPGERINQESSSTSSADWRQAWRFPIPPIPTSNDQGHAVAVVARPQLRRVGRDSRGRPITAPGASLSGPNFSSEALSLRYDRDSVITPWRIRTTTAHGLSDLPVLRISPRTATRSDSVAEGKLHVTTP